MKETIFQFELKMDSESSEVVLQGLKEKLIGLKGVESIETTHNEHRTELQIRVCFDDSDAAMKLHRKVMNKIIGHDGLTIAAVKTTLTDIF